MIKFRKKKYYMLDDKDPKIVLDYNGETINLYNVDIKPSRANKEILVKFIDYMSTNSSQDNTKGYDGVGFLKRYDDAYNSIKNSLDADTKRLLDIQGIMSKKSGYEPEKIRNLISVAYRSLNKVKNDISNIEGRELIFSNDEYSIEKLTTPQAVIAFGNGDCWCCICGVNLQTGTPYPDQVAYARSAMVGNSNIGNDNEGKEIRGDYYGFHNKNTGKKYFFQYKEGYPNNYKVWSQRDKKLFEKMGDNSKISMSNSYAPQALEFLRGLKDIDHLGNIKVNFKELYDIAMDKDKKEQLIRETALAGYGAEELEVVQEMTPEEKKELKKRETLRKIQLIENEFEDTLEFSIIGNLISVHLSLKGSYKAKEELNRIFAFDGTTIVIYENNLGKLSQFVDKIKELLEREPEKIKDPDDESIEHVEVPFELEGLTFIIHFGDILRYVDTSKMSEAELKYIKRRDENRVVTGNENILNMLDALIKSPNLLRFDNGYLRLSKELTSINVFATKFKEKEWYDEENHQQIADTMNELVDKKIKDVYGTGSKRDTNFSRIVSGINRVLGKPLEFRIPTIKEDNIKYDDIIKDYNVIRTRGGYLLTSCVTTYINKIENGEKLTKEDIDKITSDSLEKFPNDKYSQKPQLITPEENDETVSAINESVEEVDPNLYSEDNQDIANSNTYIPINEVNEDTDATAIEWINSKTNYINLKSIINVLIKNNIATCKQALDFFNELGLNNIKVGKKNNPLNNNTKDMLKASLDALNEKFNNTEQEEVEEEPEVIEEEQEETNMKNRMTREEILEETQGRGFEFDNGDYYGIDFDEENQILFAGSISNAGVSRNVEIEYDTDKSIGGNLEALYSKCVEENPDLLNEVEVDEVEEPEVIEEEVEEQEEVNNSPTKETHDGGVLSLDENGDIQITYPGNENEAETSYVVIDLETYANTDELTIVPENFHEMIDELVRQCDLDDFEAQEYCERVLSYLNIIMDWEDEEEEEEE